MKIRNGRPWFIPVLLIFGALTIPVSSQAQCVVSSSNASSTPPTIFVFKTLSTVVNCALTMSMNVLGCFPTAGTSTSILSASASTAATNPSCAWACDCGGVTIDSSNGLPVELMEFSVETESAGEPAATENPEPADTGG